MTPDPLFAVTGGSGFFGRALEPRLARLGRLRGLFRSESDITRHWRHAGHEVVFGDICDEDSLSSLVEGADVVYHLAARKAKDDPSESHRVNVTGTERLTRAAAASGVERLLYVSSISVYAATPAASLAAGCAAADEPHVPGFTSEDVATDGVVTEDVEPRAPELLNLYSATKYRGEEVVRRLFRHGESPDYTVVRPTNVYGPWGHSWFLDWVRRLKRLPIVMGGDVPVDLVHVHDVADGLIRAAEADAAVCETLHLGHRSVRLGEYATLLGSGIGVNVRRLPAPLDRGVRVILERGHRILHGTHRSTPLTRRIRYPHVKAARLIGYDPAITLEEGLDATLRWYREVYSPRIRG